MAGTNRIHSSPHPRLAVVVALSLAAAVLPSAHGAAAKRRVTASPRPVPMVWHVETLDGAEVTSLEGDAPINPASVVKAATTLWALDELGPEHRFDTVFAATGVVDPRSGALGGDLVVHGAGDPDFMAENAFLVGARLNQMGIRSVRGSLRVDDTFWLGWEGGSERALKDRAARASQMAQRLRAALDPKRWSAATRNAWRQFSQRYSLPVSQPPAVVVSGGAAALSGSVAGERILFSHRSKPLVDTLRRFDCYSNNDIERLGASLGSPDALARKLASGWGLPADAVRLETISGLGTNRMSPRLVVRLIRELKTETERLGLSIESVLPVAGCDPGTLNHSFAPLGVGPNRMSVVAKTGTLTATDGGTAVLAGIVSTARGDLVFCVAAPSAAGRLHQARRQQTKWVEDLIARSDGPRLRKCAGPLASPEDGASIVPAGAPAWTQSRRAAP